LDIEKGIPVEEIEFDKRDAVIAFAWQPSGSMFAVIHGKGAKPDVSIYGVKKVKQERNEKEITAEIREENVSC
jgi:translation initiation factor 3 subunit B